MKVSKDFKLKEFIPPDIYSQYGKKSKWFLQSKMIRLAQFYRDYFDVPMYVNTWHFGGDLEYRGYRPPDCQIGSFMSQHKMGNAFDCDIKDKTADEVRQEIKDNEREFMRAGLTTLESGEYAPTWTHSDCRTTDMDKILIVKP